MRYVNQTLVIPQKLKKKQSRPSSPTAGIKGNEKADEIARKAAKNGFYWA